MLILELPLEISAREIYSQVREYSSGESSAALVRALAAADSAAVKANMSNDLERVAIFLYPEIGDSIDQLKELYGSDAAVLMSGSGPTVFAYFQEGYGDRPPLQLGESSKAKAHLVSLL
jgi:4-diphosphocytidyl-2C-methyl-D-erythritol kinase